MDYTFEPLCADDVIPLCKIIKGIGIDTIRKEIKQIKFKSMMDDNKNNLEAQMEFTVDLATSVLEIVTANIDKVHNDVKKLLANKTGKTVKEISKLKFNEYIEMILAFINQEEFGDFFTLVAKSLGLTI